jgi:hypothetical protein
VNTLPSRALAALALQSAALLALAWALLGGSWLDARSKPTGLVLVDRSQSMPRGDVDRALSEMVRADRAAGSGALQVIEFAGRAAAPSLSVGESTVGLRPSATNIEAALDAALAAHAQTPLAGVVVVSDGLENAGDASRGLRAAREARLPVHWVAVGRPPPLTHIAQVLAPGRAQLGQTIRLAVQLAGQLDRPLRIKASARSADGQRLPAYGEPDAEGRATIEFEARATGAVIVDLALEDPASGQTLHRSEDAAVVDVGPRAALLYAQGGSGLLAHSLLQGGWSLQVVPASRLDAQADALEGVQAVVLDDVAIADAGPRFWSALVAAVKDRGLGLVVLGGERSFARGGYRGSTLESVLPVRSEPAALDQPAAVVFAVDKSGSMGQGSGGVDRFQLAQRAVLETARGLTERDSLGLVVFDVAPRVLVPLGPAAVGTEALARSWQASPNGGTRLAPALEAAITELEGSALARRMLVLVTDGFVDGAPGADLRARLSRARIETVALAVGPDADAAALARVFGTDAASVLRVDQAAELPTVMRSGLQSRRARVERGPIAVQQVLALPFAPGTLQAWPTIAAHAVTRPQAGAAVAVQSPRGEPVVAFANVGRGRVAAVTSGLGSWTPQWLVWREWPRLAGGLAQWASGAPLGGAGVLAVRDLASGLQVEADLPPGEGEAAAAPVSISVDTPKTRGQALAAEPMAPGRWRATLPDAGPGLYTFIVSTAQGTQRQLHLRRQALESDAWGIGPALQAWSAAGLISPWQPGALAAQRAGANPDRPPDRSLVALALLLFLMGVVVDRTRFEGVRPGALLRAWRAHRLRDTGAA